MGSADATSTDLNVDPDRSLPGRPGHLLARQAPADHNRRHPLADRAVVNLARPGPDDVTANHHADGHAHAHEFGVPDWHSASGPLTDGDAICGRHAVRGGDANVLSQRFGATLVVLRVNSSGAGAGRLGHGQGG
jgi:hypothetical protein